MKPIIFSTPMVQAILDGKKSQTRRVVKPQPEQLKSGLFKWKYFLDMIGENEIKHKLSNHMPYAKGDILWVRETWCRREDVRGGFFDDVPNDFIGFKADDNGQIQPYFEAAVKKWRPLIHMPRVAARIFLRVMDMRVERLQDISPEECVKEGSVKKLCLDCDECALGCSATPRDGARIFFEILWNSLNSKRDYSWKSNPWVWVIEFERIEKPEGAGM